MCGWWVVTRFDPCHYRLVALRFSGGGLRILFWCLVLVSCSGFLFWFLVLVSCSGFLFWCCVLVFALVLFFAWGDFVLVVFELEA
jgi:hypothetical protein